MVKADGVQLVRLGLSEMSLRPQSILPSSHALRPQWPSYSSAQAFAEAWLGWVYVCTMKNAWALASVPWMVHRRVGMKLEPWPEHVLQRVLNRPNPWWSQRDLIMRIAIELQIAGNSIIGKVRAEPTGPTLNLFTVRPQLIAPMPSTDVHVAGFSVMAADGQRYFLGARNAVHVQLPDPTDPYWGMSIVRAGRQPIDTDRRAAEWQAAALDQTLVPPGAFIINDEQGMSDDQFAAAVTQLKAQYQGCLNARVPLILSNTKWQQLSISPAEMDWLGGRTASKKEIGLLFGVPLPLLGEQNTYANMGEARTAHWQDGVLPLAALMSDAMTIQLAEPEYGEDVVIAPDIRRVPALVNSRLEQIKGVRELWNMGAPFNAAADYMGLDFQFPGGDVGYVPSNLLASTPEGGIDAVDMIDADRAPNEASFRRLESERRPARRARKQLTAEDFRRWLRKDIEDAELVDE